jgi:hypothetical protein
VHLDLPLATKNWNLFFRIHLGAEVESFYFKFLLTEFIYYEHARSSSSAGDQNHVRTIVNVGSLEKFLNQGGINHNCQPSDFIVRVLDGISVPKTVRATPGSEKDLTPINITLRTYA